ncbi:hypothetical protein F4808DRAFT_445591 [Astrocystis sublimbata]|nr:hypothetical protein F4808DRAFT_445591 [Astrocystis sublimbata]
MMEMMQPLYWVDMIFGLFEGWWLFDDGRTHAVASESVWEAALCSAGYSHTLWTDGNSHEVKIERVLLAVNSPPGRYEIPTSVPESHHESRSALTANLVPRRAAVDEYVRKYVQGTRILEDSFSCVPRTPKGSVWWSPEGRGAWVLISQHSSQGTIKYTGSSV